VLTTPQEASENGEPADTEDLMIVDAVDEPTPGSEHEKQGLSLFLLAVEDVTTSAEASDNALYHSTPVSHTPASEHGTKRLSPAATDPEDIGLDSSNLAPAASEREDQGLSPCFLEVVDLTTPEDASEDDFSHVTPNPHTPTSEGDEYEFSSVDNDSEDAVSVESKSESENEEQSLSFFFLEAADLTISIEDPDGATPFSCTLLSDKEVDEFDDSSTNMDSESSGYCSSQGSQYDILRYDEDIWEDGIDGDFDYDTGLILDTNDYACAVCDRPMTSIEQLYLHTIQEHCTLKGQCPLYCDKRHSERNSMWNHIMNAHWHQEFARLYRCHFCLQTQKSWGGAAKHFYTHHNRKQREPRSSERRTTRSMSHAFPQILQGQFSEKALRKLKRKEHHLTLAFPDEDAPTATSFVDICDCEDSTTFMERLKVR